ncbi:hypothetical protein [Microbulbifer agarilyticus]
MQRQVTTGAAMEKADQLFTGLVESDEIANNSHSSIKKAPTIFNG